MPRHSDIAANRGHEPAFHSATDPALDANNRVTAGKQWVDITVPTAPILYIRNEANSAWVLMSGATTFSDATFAINDSTTPSIQIKFDAAGTASTSTTLLSSQTTNKILTLPNATDTLVGKATTDTLTNKTLTAPVIATIVNTGTLTLPTSTDTLVGRATTDTLTNKTLTAPVIATIVNTGTLTLPTSTDTLVGRATTDTLTNKSLVDSSTFIVDDGDNTKKLQFQVSTITTATTRTLTVPNADTTIVGTAIVQTLSNKVIDNSNSITVKDNSFTVQDDADTSKQLVLQLSGITTGTTRTLTVPDANTTIVGTDATQTLTNKTLTAPIIATIVNTGTLTLPTSTDTLVGRATTDTLTNKTLTSSTNHVAAESLFSATTTINVSSATAPTSGQVLTATSGTAATWQTPGGGGGGMTIYKQTTGGDTTVGNSSSITTPLMALGRVTVPASTTQTVTINKGGSAASNIYSVMLTTKGNWSNLVYLEDVAGNVFPKVGSTITINNNDTVSHDVYVMVILD